MNRLIPTSKIVDRLQFENPWWTSGAIPQVYDAMKIRLYFNLFYPLLIDDAVRRALVLMGPRRVGKTVMLYHSIRQLLADGLHPRKILFVGVDNPLYVNMSLEDFLDLFKDAALDKSLETCYVFFDEIQYLKDWERHLKILVDSYPKVQFIVSGSAAAALNWHSTESGAGRFTDFRLPPLTFYEFIHLRDLGHLMIEGSIQYEQHTLPYELTRDLKALNQEFVNYLNFGGYPEVVFSEKIQSDMSRFIKYDIVDKVLLRDLPSLYGIRDVQELNRFFTYLAYNTGNEFDYQTMAKESGTKIDTIKKYLEYLEAAFLIKVLHKVGVNSRRFKRVTAFKVYLTNTSLRTALFSPVTATDQEMGNLIETTILSQWMHREKLELTYARWNKGRGKSGEVDLIQLDHATQKPAWAVEVKWSDRYISNPKELKSLKEFCTANNLNAAVVTTITEQGNLLQDGLDFTFIPAAVYTYNVGKKTLERN